MLSKYTLHEKLGEGGYGSVHKCTDAIGVRYACKVLPKNHNRRNRVQHEINIMKMLKNSCKVVRFIEAGEDDTAFYIVQELCRGGCVKDYISSYENYGENTVASVIRGVLRGLIHMHDLGIIHRDVKPSNVLLGDRSDDADVKLGDLGTAILAELETVEVDELLGTVFFMSPENLSYKYHMKSDIWSVGVMAYQLLSGKMPFNDHDNPYSPDVPKIWRSILTEEPRLRGSRWATVNDEAKEFIRMCLQKSYVDRPTAMEALNHAWLTKTECVDRFKGTPLTCEPFRFEEMSLMNAKTFTKPGSTLLY